MTTRLMKIVASEDNWEQQKWTATSARETKRLLDDAIAYERYHENKPKILIHTNGWLCSGYAQLNITHAKQMIDDAFSRGNECVETYEWIESGHIEGRVQILNFGIVLDVSAKINRTAESQAQQDEEE